MITPKVIVTCDACCTLPPQHKTNLHIPSIPATIKTDKGEFLEGAEITTQNILDYMSRTGKTPRLIPPTVEEYRRFFMEQQGNAPVICHFCASSRLSEAYRNATEAAVSLKNVYVIDSLQVGSGMNYQVIQGARLASEGFGAEFIKKSSEEIEPNIVNRYTGENTDFLRICKNGKSIWCSIMDVFGRTPAVSVKGGVIKGSSARNNSKGEYWKKFIKKELAEQKNISKEIVFLTFANPYKVDVEKYINEVKKYVAFDRIVVTNMSPQIAMYMGEKGFGLSYLLR